MNASPQKLTTVLFDLDGTLRANRPAGRDFFMDFTATLGVPVTPEARRRVGVWEHTYWAESPDLLADKAQYPDDATFWPNYTRRQLHALGCATDQVEALAPEVSAYMNQFYRPEDYVDPAALEVLAALKAHGLTIGVVSNREENFHPYLETLGIAPHVHFSLGTDEAGAKKPDPAIFHFALKKAGAQPHEAVYVGDNYFADVVGARRAGLFPVLIDPPVVFENPDCAVIRSMRELPKVLEVSHGLGA